MSIPASYTLQVKHVFLNFIQQYFAQVADSRYRWSVDQRATRIIIADKHGVDKPINERRPLIILSRHALRPLFMTMKQRRSLKQLHSVESYADLLRGSVTLNCLAKSGIVAEELAHIVLIALMSNRDQLKGYNGIHQISSIQIGEEVAVVSDVESILTNVPVTIQYTKNIAWTPAPVLSTAGSIILTSGGATVDTWYEGLDYDVYRNRITTYSPIPSGYSGLVSYLDATLLNTVENSLSGINGVETEFLTSNRIYSYYPAVHEVRISAAISGITYYFPAHITDADDYPYWDTYPYSGVVTDSGIVYDYSGLVTEPVYSGWVNVSGEYSGMI